MTLACAPLRPARDVEGVVASGHSTPPVSASTGTPTREVRDDRADRERVAEAEIGRELDDFHDAAAHADEARYFGHFAAGAVFLGTDATERWFDDGLSTPNLGPARGSGALVREGGAWKIAQYVLSVTVPNSRMHELRQLLESAAPAR